jgi:DNA-directed RNA polymerase specialized sigma24 family protein
LWRGLKGLDRSQRRLVLGRLLLRRSWRELGRPLGLSGKVSQRRCQRALALLRQRLLEGDQLGNQAGNQTSPSPWASSIASTAASSV